MTQQDQNNSEEIASSGVIGGHRRETERRRRHRFTRILSLAGILLLITALVIPATGYYVVFVQPHRETALVINDTRYTWGGLSDAAEDDHCGGAGNRHMVAGVSKQPDI